MNAPDILAATIAFSSSVFATPFDSTSSGESSVYVSILDKNHMDIRTESNKLSYREFLKYNTKYIKGKNRDRYIYNIENYGITKDGLLLGSMTITRSKDGKILADYYFSSKNEYPDKSTSSYEVDDTRGGHAITKTNIVNPELPHKRVVCLPKGGGEEIEWLIFYPAHIGATLTKESLWKSSGSCTMILYCPKLGLIDLVGSDLNKSKTIPYTEHEKLRANHPMHKETSNDSRK